MKFNRKSEDINEKFKISKIIYRKSVSKTQSKHENHILKYFRVFYGASYVQKFKKNKLANI
jgi:hypothetical protein